MALSVSLSLSLPPRHKPALQSRFHTSRPGDCYAPTQSPSLSLAPLPRRRPPRRSLCTSRALFAASALRPARPARPAPWRRQPRTHTHAHAAPPISARQTDGTRTPAGRPVGPRHRGRGQGAALHPRPRASVQGARTARRSRRARRSPEAGALRCTLHCTLHCTKRTALAGTGGATPPRTGRDIRW